MVATQELSNWTVTYTSTGTQSTDINNTIESFQYSWTTTMGTIVPSNRGYSTKTLPDFEDGESLRLKELLKQEIHRAVRQSWKTVRHKEIIERKFARQINRPRRMMFSMSGWLAPVGKKKRGG